MKSERANFSQILVL